MTDITRFYFHSIGACSVFLASCSTLFAATLHILINRFNFKVLLNSITMKPQALFGAWCRELVCSSISSLLHQMFIPVERNKKSDFKVSHFESQSCIFHFSVDVPKVSVCLVGGVSFAPTILKGEGMYCTK